ncbi:MAG: uracil-DNA glycosylase [Burkholderiales bacterium]
MNLACRDCPRLAAHLDRVRQSHPEYHARPVSAFGDDHSRLLIVGLAPGMHGANRTGRPFTGDHAGVLLYSTLHAYGFASRPNSFSSDDGLVLQGCRITNAVKCLPPQNKPLSSEVKNCNRYLRAELETLPRDSVVLALGRVAHHAVLMTLDLRLSDYPFAHGAIHRLPHRITLAASYHCSRYNTQTKRLSENMFNDVFNDITTLLRESQCPM